jgi:hypothetical protein
MRWLRSRRKYMTKRRRSPPSRERYNVSHPTLSVRVTQPLYKELMDLRQLTGKSLGDILREALGKQVPSAKNAHLKGYEEARLRYAVPYKCSICGGNLTIESDHAKRAAATYMREHGWRHNTCAQIGNRP